MKAAVALLLSFAMFGCFPHNPKHRTYAKYAEGAALVSGIAISAFANTGADCDEMVMPGPNVDNNCRQSAKWLSTAGVTLILAGLLGFVATISTAEDLEVQQQIQAAQQPTTDETKQVKLPPGVTPPAQDAQTSGQQAGSADEAPQPTGSASQTPSAPQP